MKYQIRKATSQDLIAAINLAWQMFLKYDAEDYGEEHTGRMRKAIEDRLNDLSIYNERIMFVAVAEAGVVGMIETYGTNRISLLFVDDKYQRMGIATALMKRTADELKEKGFKDIVLNASPYGVPFYKNFGFSVEENKRNPLTPWKTPMTYSLSTK